MPQLQTDSFLQPKRSPLGSLELRCPPLPHTIVEAFDLIDHPEKMDVATVTRLVERDPSVAARLLQNVNSAYYGLKRTITSVERAVVLIGPVAVTGIVIGMNMLRLKTVVRPSAAETYARLMRHSLATAFIARHLDEGVPGQRVRQGDDQQFGIAFTAGLLHDFGKIILVYNHPDQAVSLYNDDALRQRGGEPDLTRLEALLFGCDHTEAGEYAARKLNFPELLVSAMRFHHGRVEDAPDDPIYNVHDILEIVQASNLAARALGYGFSIPLRWVACMEAPVWAALCERKRVPFEDPQDLLNDIYLQRHHIDAYVGPLTASLSESLA